MLTGVRTEKFKLNFYDKPITGELYDLQNDSGEVTNLCDDPHHKDTSDMMLPIFVGRMIESTDPLPERHSSW
jgi:arylsulfatase